MAGKKEGGMAKKGKESEYALAVLMIFTAAIIIIILTSMFYSLFQFSKAREINILAECPQADCKQEEAINQFLYSEIIGLKEDLVELGNELNETARINTLLEKRINATQNVSAIQFSRVSRDDLRIYKDRVILLEDNVFLVRFTNSTSMYPYINENVFALQVRPEKPEELSVGDIIGFDSKTFDMLIIHRIMEIRSDEGGWYAITKGDTNTKPDPEKVRFSQVKGVLIGLLY